MASTYTPIATNTISGNSTSSITFSSIPNTYTDLIIVSSVGSTDGVYSLYAQFNNDTASNYTFTYLYSNGTSAISGRSSSTVGVTSGFYVTPGTTINNINILNIMNYSSTSSYKTTIARSNTTTSPYPGTETSSSLWRSTSAINTVRLFVQAGYFLAGSQFTLYGIKGA